MMLKETLATLSVVLVTVVVPAFMVMQNQRAIASVGQGTEVYTLFGVAKDGAWTLESVNGTNYWWKHFRPVTLYLQQGQDVVLRLQGTDVHHRFYAPGLGVGPIDVEPGHTEIVRFKARALGKFRYYCTSLCGHCHFYMSGWIVVLPKGQTIESISEELLEDLQCRLHDLPEPSKDDMVQWGRYLYEKNGCTTCHGKDGQGQIPNLNATKKTVPAHNNLTEKFFLEDAESTKAFIDLLIKRRNLDQIETHDDIPRFMLVRTQYKAARDLIIKGQTTAKLDPAGLEPPLQMPSWRELLTDRDIDSIIAYLLTLYPWDEEEYEEDPLPAGPISSQTSNPSEPQDSVLP